MNNPVVIFNKHADRGSNGACGGFLHRCIAAIDEPVCAEMAIEDFGKLAAERLKIGPVVLGALLVEVDSDGSGAIDAQEFNRVRTRVSPIRSKAAQLSAW